MPAKAKTEPKEPKEEPIAEDREDYFTWQEGDIIWVDEKDLEEIPEEEK